MKHEYNVYALHDDVGDLFADPFVARNDEIAIRNTRIALQQTQMKEFVKDFSLYCIGTYDAESGKITPQDVLTCVMRGFSEKGE